MQCAIPPIQVLRVTFQAPDSIAPMVLEEQLIKGETWIQWEVRSGNLSKQQFMATSEAMVAFVLIYEQDVSITMSAAKLQIEVPPETALVLEARADNWLWQSPAQATAVTQPLSPALLYPPAAPDSCCLPDMAGNTLNRESIAEDGNILDAANQTADDTNAGLRLRRHLIQTSPASKLLDGAEIASGNGYAELETVAGGMTTALELIGLQEGKMYEVYYLLQDKGEECGLQNVNGKHLLNRRLSGFTFTPGLPLCQPAIEKISIGPECASLSVTVVSNGELTEVFIIFGQQAEQDPQPRPEHVISAVEDNISSDFPWITSKSFRVDKHIIQPDVDQIEVVEAVDLEELEPDTSYWMYVVARTGKGQENKECVSEPV
eukprot:scaffold195692_cov36-Prasinocladus_malaysianus.AAC.3